jgi:hypothetical protein
MRSNWRLPFRSIYASLSIQVPVATPEEKQPVDFQEEKPAVIRTPPRVKSRNESRVNGVQQMRSRARAPAKREPPSPQYFFEPFGNQQPRQTSAVNTANSFGNQQARQAPTAKANNYLGNLEAGQTQTPNASNY